MDRRDATRPLQERSECMICNNAFDTDSHRPRALPCGHGFCTQCIQSCIDRGNTACSVCRKKHKANSATSLPVSFLLEEQLQRATTSAPQAQDPVSVQLDNAVMCPEHSGIPLYFHCKTHGVEICHSCAVIDHPRASCKLISIKDKMKETKETEIEKIQKGKKGLKDTENDLNKLYQDNDNSLTEKEKKKQGLEKEVESLLNKIDQTNQEITESKKSKNHIKDSIVSCQMKQKSMDALEAKLRTTSGNQAISQECAKTTNEIMKIEKWEDKLRKEFKLNIHNVEYAQVERNGIIRSSKIVREGGRMFIPSLTKELKPPSSAKLWKESELGLTSANTKVFLELSAHGCSLGRVIINVQGDRSYGRQFVMIATGITGNTFRNAKFSDHSDAYIKMTHYVTESGSHTKAAVLSPLRTTPQEAKLRGKVFCFNEGTAGFSIITKDWGSYHDTIFGNVISGMDVVDRFHSKVSTRELPISDVRVSDCGIILNY